MAMHGIKDKVAVLGVGCAKFGDRFEASYDDLALEAAKDAFADAGIGPERVDAAWLGTYLPNNGWGKASVGLADSLRFYDKPITRVENFCATGTEAFRAACLAVASGMYDVALALGVEKMKDRASRGIPRAGQHPLLARGATAPGLFALAATRWMHEYKQDRTPLAMVAVKNHANGAKNPKAHMQKEVTMDQVLKAPIIASPFGLFDCCPTTDGAAAAIVCRPEIARELGKEPVLVKGIGLAVTTGRPFNDPNFAYTGFKATQLASKQAYEQAGIGAKDVDFAEVHDCFTWTELTNYEDLGFAEKGRGHELIREGVTALDGKKPVNPSGGLKSFGHPIGASGIRMVYEVTSQLRGKGGARQVKKADVGLAHNVGGPGAVSCVIVLGRA